MHITGRQTRWFEHCKKEVNKSIQALQDSKQDANRLRHIRLYKLYQPH